MSLVQIFAWSSLRRVGASFYSRQLAEVQLAHSPQHTITELRAYM